MKVFCVSTACNACGECVLSTDLLIENEEGFAVPVSGRYIEDAKLAEAEKIAGQCPAGALSIIERTSVSSDGGNALLQLVQVMEKRMRAVQIPDVSIKELEFKEGDYKIAHGSVNEWREKYPSFEAALAAGKEQFNIVYWNHMKDFVTNVLTQYKSKVLRQYYDLSDPEHTYYAGIGRQMTSILEDIKAEACSLSDHPLTFPDDFIQFCPERDRSFKDYLEEQYDRYIVSTEYIKSFCEGFEKEDKANGRDFRLIGMISAEGSGQMETKNLFGKTVWKPAYRMKDVNSTGERMIERLLFNLSYPRGCGLRGLDEIYEDNLKFVMEQYRKLVDTQINKKVEMFKKISEK